MPPAPTAAASALDEDRFAFGENWASFVEVIDEDRVEAATRALSAMLGLERLDGLTFLDAGSGSGLSSLAALRLGAARVHSFDTLLHADTEARRVASDLLGAHA